MTKSEFLDELCRRIKMLPPEEAERAVSFYSETIDDKIESGMTEEEAVASLGSMDDIALQVESAALKSTPQQKKVGKKAIKTLLAIAIVVIIAASVAFAAGELVSFFTKDIASVPEPLELSPNDVAVISVKSVSGDITITESPDERIHVDAGKGYEVVRGVTLTVKPHGTGTLYGSNPVTVSLPKGYTPALALMTASGKISVGADCAAVNVDSVSGDVVFENVSAGNIDITSVSGSATGMLNAGREDYLVLFSSVSGSNSVTAYEPQPFEYRLSFESVSGNLDISFK